jgi:hypothetical protein
MSEHPPPAGRALQRRSLIYRDVFWYRLLMGFLYRGGYRVRYERALEVIGANVTSVCDVCFADTIIATWCREHGVRWTGIDINPVFCREARALGFDVIEGDLLAVELPRADVFVMGASLYHFHDQVPRLLDRVFARTDRFIISEPVRNLADAGGALGRVASRMTNPGTGHPAFHYNEQTLLAALRAEQERTGLQLRVVSIDREMLIEMWR